MCKSTRLGVLWLVCAFAAFAAPLPLAAQEVTLPLSQYEQLRSRANPKPDEPAPPPARFALESADLEIAVGPSSARIVQKLVLSVFSDTWERVPLGEAGSFTSARFGALEGRVEVSEKEGWAMQVHGRGRHEVTLESVVPVKRDETSTRPASAFSLRLPPAAVLRGKLQTQPGVDEVTLTGKGMVRGAAGGPWTFVSAFDKDAGVTFTLFGQRTLPERAQLPLRFDATSATAATLSRTQLRVRGWVEARVAQGRLSELRIPIPADLKVVSVSGPLAGWDVTEGTLVLTPLEPVEGTLAVEMELEGEPRPAFASPVLTPAGGRRTVHLVKAALQGDGLLTLADPEAVRGPEESETARVPPSIQGAGGRLLVVSDPARPPRWEAEWAEETQVLAAQVDRLLLDVAIGESGRAVYRLWAEVRNRGAQQLVLQLPPGFELTTARRDGEEVTAGAVPGGLAVPLLTRDAAQAVHLDGVLPLTLPQGKGELSLPLPGLSAPAARVEVRLVLPGGRTWRLADPSRSGPVQGPPQGAPVSAVSSNALAAQMKSVAANIATSGPLPGMFLVPPGYREITAAWSALSANPGPLVLRVEMEKEATPWM
ncbi:MAG TPA: hypothetical protein VEW48_25660 [Thermoanaerobaculia bacterium]|nr:hypothetical protein [Thermoanaerobaculia bacterium]